MCLLKYVLHHAGRARASSDCNVPSMQYVSIHVPVCDHFDMIWVSLSKAYYISLLALKAGVGEN